MTAPKTLDVPITMSVMRRSMSLVRRLTIMEKPRYRTTPMTMLYTKAHFTASLATAKRSGRFQILDRSRARLYSANCTYTWAAQYFIIFVLMWSGQTIKTGHGRNSGEVSKEKDSSSIFLCVAHKGSDFCLHATQYKQHSRMMYAQMATVAMETLSGCVMAVSPVSDA